jgi:threonine/homoserine/homoserine lactone efflux protein
MHPDLWAYAAIVVPIVMTPGLSTALVLRNSVEGGRRAGVATAIGANAASLLYGVMTGFGVAIALRRWPVAWTVLRTGGLAYLVWLGLRSLVHAWRGRRIAAGDAASPRAVRQHRQHASEGFLVNLTNPSIATFYLVIVPSFIPRGAPVIANALLLTAIHVTLALTWHVSWAAAAGTHSQTITRPGPRRARDAVTGFALLGIAAKVAVT